MTQFGAELNAMPGGSEFHAGALRAAVLAFLKGVLASGPIAVCELEAKARSAGLLTERQHVTDAKIFKSAKKTLGIRSVRYGFGPAGEWFWTMQQRPGSEIHEPAGHVSTNQPPAIIYGADFELPANAVESIGVPREWIHGIASLDRHRAPAHVPLHRWRLFIGDCEQFVDIWGATAADKGWSAEALFGCAIAQPLANLQMAGLLWTLRGGKLLRLYPHSALIETGDGSHRVFNRRTIGTQVVKLPWHFCRQPDDRQNSERHRLNQVGA